MRPLNRQSRLVFERSLSSSSFSGLQQHISSTTIGSQTIIDSRQRHTTRYRSSSSSSGGSRKNDMAVLLPPDHEFRCGSHARLQEVVEEYSEQAIRPVTITQLIESRVSADFLAQELSIRFAHRILDFRQLPFVVLMNPNFLEVYHLYLRTLDEIITDMGVTPDLRAQSSGGFLRRKSSEVIAKVTIQRLMYQHKDVIELLQAGYQDFTQFDLSGFLNRVFITRIGNRVLGESFKRGAAVVTSDVSPFTLVKQMEPLLHKIVKEAYPNHPLLSQCILPKIILKGDVDVKFTFIQEHLTFILQEVLKNAMRATIENQMSAQIGAAPRTVNGIAKFPPIVVEVWKGDFEVIIKISDQGGGIHPDSKKQVWKYGFTTVPRNFDDAIVLDEDMPNGIRNGAQSENMSNGGTRTEKMSNGAHSHSESEEGGLIDRHVEKTIGGVQKQSMAKLQTIGGDNYRDSEKELYIPTLFGTNGNGFGGVNGNGSARIRNPYQPDHYGRVLQNRPPSLPKSAFRRQTSAELAVSNSTGETTPKTRKVAGYGFGLPLSKLYARYFGGDIHFQSMYGYGTDVYVHLNHLGNVHEKMDL